MAEEQREGPMAEKKELPKESDQSSTSNAQGPVPPPDPPEPVNKQGRSKSA